MRTLFRIVASLASLSVIVQVGFAGYGAFNAIDKADDAGSVSKHTVDNGFDPHGALGSIVLVLLLILLIVALVARVNVILRRMASRTQDAKASMAALSQGRLSVDPEQHIAEFAGTPLRLTAIEFGILRAFLTRPTLVFSREQIMSAAYQLNIQVSDRTIDSHIRNIRAKLSAVNCDNVIETIHGVGFKLGRCEPLA